MILPNLRVGCRAVHIAHDAHVYLPYLIDRDLGFIDHRVFGSCTTAAFVRGTNRNGSSVRD